MRAVASGSSVTKNAIRAMVIAALCGSTSALGENNERTNHAAEYVMAAYVVVFEQFPVSVCLLIHFVQMLIVIICVLQCNQQPMVVIQTRDESSAISTTAKSSRTLKAKTTSHSPQVP